MRGWSTLKNPEVSRSIQEYPEVPGNTQKYPVVNDSQWQIFTEINCQWQSTVRSVTVSAFRLLVNIELDSGLDEVLRFESKHFHPYMHHHWLELQSEKHRFQLLDLFFAYLSLQLPIFSYAIFLVFLFFIWHLLH